MHRGFNFKPDQDNYFRTDEFLLGNRVYEEYKEIAKKTLDKYVSPDGSINASKMQEDWFPQQPIKSDVFISHSHKDKNLAISFAGWLFKNFGLRSFIDSCIWGFADELLRAIDNRYCWMDENETLYNYNLRNISTSHVHMMLSSALMKMMDKTECLFFLNTINSITPQGFIEQTESPWIYSEVTMSQLLHWNKTGREKRSELESTRAMSDKLILESKLPSFKYTLGFGHLTDLDEIRLELWRIGKNNNDHPLDILYNQNPKKTISQ